MQCVYTRQALVMPAGSEPMVQGITSSRLPGIPATCIRSIPSWRMFLNICRMIQLTVCCGTMRLLFVIDCLCSGGDAVVTSIISGGGSPVRLRLSALACSLGNSLRQLTLPSIRIAFNLRYTVQGHPGPGGITDE